MESAKYRSIIINGIRFSGTRLEYLLNQTLKTTSKDNWEHHLFGFISQWMNEKVQTITAHTSGTTGKPKPIRLSKERMIESALRTIRFLKLKKDDTALLCLSCEHIAGKMMVTRAVAGSLNLVPVEPVANPLKKVVVGQKIDFAAFVPLQVKEILSDKTTAKRFGQIRNVIIGGAPVDFELKLRLKKFKSNIYETYGMTETVSHIALKRLSNPSKLQTPHHYFTTLPGVTVKTDNRSCLVFNAPHLSSKPIITNDLAEVTGKNKFKWLGRFDNTVNSGGVKLIPELLEQKIQSVLLKTRFFFTGMYDARLGERLVLVIEGKQMSKDEMNKLKRYLSRKLAKYEFPKEILFIQKFPTTSSGKILRKLKFKS